MVELLIKISSYQPRGAPRNELRDYAFTMTVSGYLHIYFLMPIIVR